MTLLLLGPEGPRGTTTENHCAWRLHRRYQETCFESQGSEEEGYGPARAAAMPSSLEAWCLERVWWSGQS